MTIMHVHLAMLQFLHRRLQTKIAAPKLHEAAGALAALKVR